MSTSRQFTRLKREAQVAAKRVLLIFRKKTLFISEFDKKNKISGKLWSSQLWTQFKQLPIEAWKSQDLNGVWTRDLAIPVRRSNQLSYEATDVEDWSFVSSNEPVKNGCEVIYEMFHIYWTADLKSSKLWSLQLWTQFKQLHIEAWESQDFIYHFTRIKYIKGFILLSEKFLQFDWLRADVFQLNLK